MKASLAGIILKGILEVLGIAISFSTMAQTTPVVKADTAFFLAHKKGLLGKIGKSLSVNNPDPVLPERGAIKNETIFHQYQGKIIRHIIIQKLGFTKSVNDTAGINKNLFNVIGDALHPSSKNRVIYNNLFFKSGDKVYPDLMADNGRYLRSISFLQDAQILVQDLPFTTDSVDIIVICKDVFPVGGSMDAGSAKFASFEVNDDNLLGTGNRIQIKNFFDVDRNPKYGLGFNFQKRNLLGTFLNLSVGYTNEAPAYNSGRREEKSLYFQGELPLVSPYHQFTGAFELAHHYTANVYLPDSLYQSDFQYNYRIIDAWLGYNIGARKQLSQNFNSRLKRLVSLRLIDRDFFEIPAIFKNNYQINYSNLTSLLGAYTLFEQDFYRTNFIYGFGRNEDVPEGFSMSFTGGWTNRNNIARPYLGFDYQRNYFSKSNNYLNYNLRFGSSFGHGRFEDISLLTSVEYFTKLKKLGNSKWFVRHFINSSFTQLVNTTLNETLRIGSDYGIPNLSNPTVLASSRVNISCETVLYNTWKLVGFSFAPFSYVNLTYLKPIGASVEFGDVYTAIGGGLRSRNENLVFGTIELKALYYPRLTGTSNQWNISLNTDIRFRYKSQLIKRPDFINVNDPGY